MVRSGRVESERENLADMIINRYIVDEWNDGNDRIKLRPVRDDRDALRRLVAGDPDEFEPASNLTDRVRARYGTAQPEPTPPRSGLHHSERKAFLIFTWGIPASMK